MPRDSDDDRPKKSWREIDKGRDKSRQRDDRPSGQPSRLERSQAYRSYKSQLNKLFDGGGVLPEALKEKLADAPVATSAKQRKADLEALVTARTPRDVRAALATFEAAHGFPDDEEALARLLDLDDGPIVLKALETVARLQAEGQLKRGASLKARIKTAIMTVDDSDVQAAGKQLLSKL